MVQHFICRYPEIVLLSIFAPIVRWKLTYTYIYILPIAVASISNEDL